MPWDDLYALATPKRSFTCSQHRQRPAAAQFHATPGGASWSPRRPRRRDDARAAATPSRAGFLDDLYAIYPDAAGS